MRRRSILTGVLILAIAAPALVYAEHTRFWRQSDFSDFEKGTAQGVAVRSDGRLMPALKFSAFSDPNLAYLWALRMDSRGRIYGAGGSDAKVLRFDDPAKPTTVFESSELAAQTIAFDAHDNLYVGTSPDGKIYKVTPAGQKSVFFDPKSKYIWSLAIDPQGVLFAGTGDDGKIFAVAPDGKGELFYQTDERHARSLAFDAKGNLLVGTDPDGLILRIEINRKDAQGPPKAGPAFVLYETDKKEVTSLLADAQRKNLRRRHWRKAAAAFAAAAHRDCDAATSLALKRAAGHHHDFRSSRKPRRPPRHSPSSLPLPAVQMWWRFHRKARPPPCGLRARNWCSRWAFPPTAKSCSAPAIRAPSSSWKAITSIPASPRPPLPR